jgi:phosphoadenosine phosphosulfate reductase
MLDRYAPAPYALDPVVLDRMARGAPAAHVTGDWVPWSAAHLAALNARFETLPPARLLAWAVETFGGDLAQGTSFGPSGVAIAHLLTQRDPEATIFYLDTGLLFPETHALRETLAERLGRSFTRVTPRRSLAEQAEREGAELWARRPDRCCHLRKVEPLRRFLRPRRAWITGIRRDQGTGRAEAPLLAWEPRYAVLKINPLAAWTRRDVWRYLFDHDLPYNALHDQGYPSLGCIPCTRPVAAAEGYSRAGRWHGTGKTECGLHG